MNTGWMISKNWRETDGETPEVYQKRTGEMMLEYERLRKDKGIPILRRRIDNTIVIHWSKEIDWNEVKNNAIDNNHFFNHNSINYWICPYCAETSGFLMRILCPKYDEGFLDKGGVAQRCLCVKYRTEEEGIWQKVKSKSKRFEE